MTGEAAKLEKSGQLAEARSKYASPKGLLK